jgi:hypothetical protein
MLRLEHSLGADDVAGMHDLLALAGGTPALVGLWERGLGRVLSVVATVGESLGHGGPGPAIPTREADDRI